MKVTRGDVVLVDYPFTAGGAKVRPALVVQNDRDNARMANTVVVVTRFRFALDSVAGGLCLLAYLGIGIFTHTI
jgi:mRNA-degrading endonuclease toxin of MazEF toxin-antitoxin module